MSTAFIALGANLPFDGFAPQQTLARAANALTAARLAPILQSSVWRSPAWPPSDQPDYYNAVAAVDATDHSPQALYAVLRSIEQRFGRERRERWAARTLDLDIVAIDGRLGEFDGIILPHPRMLERAFVLAPFAEIAPGWEHPLLGRTASELLEALPPGQIAVAGPLTPV